MDRHHTRLGFSRDKGKSNSMLRANPAGSLCLALVAPPALYFEPSSAAILSAVAGVAIR
jgi:hypothetical protein